MKFILRILVVVCCAVGVLFASETAIDSFTARSSSGDITIEWHSSIESNLKTYEIERAVSAQAPYKKIASVTPTGSGSTYRHTDENAFFRSGDGESISATEYFYRLKIISSDNSFDFSDRISVTHTVSSVRRTWGMIKEMFR